MKREKKMILNYERIEMIQKRAKNDHPDNWRGGGRAIVIGVDEEC